MSLATLERSISNARALIPSGPTRLKATDPYATDTGFSSYDDGSEQAADQYQHYRGTFWSAARIVVHRFASQGVMAARRTRRPTANSVGEQIRNGFLPTGSVPTWLTDINRLELLDVHPVLTAMRDPNPVMTEFNMREMIGGSLLATGRSYLVALESSTPGRTFDLWPVPSTWMCRDERVKNQWRIKPPGSAAQGIPVNDSQVAQGYFADPSNPGKAISPLAMLARSVLVDEAIQGAQHSEFKNGPIPKVALIAGDTMNESSFTDDPNRVSAARPVRLEPHQRRQIVTWFQQQFAGVQKHGLPIVLDAIIRDIKVLSRKPEEMAFQDSADLTKEQIFGGIGVSELLSGKLEGVSRASGALAEQFAVDYCLNPMITLFSQGATKKLGPLFSLDGESLVLWVCPVVPRDVELVLALVKEGRLTYALRRNEVRAIISQFTGLRLPWVEGFDDVVMPQTLDQRDSDEPLLGVGRDETGSGIEQMNGGAQRSLLLPPGMNGRH